MCNLYSMTTTTEAIQKLVAEWEDAMRNVPPLHAIYPDYTAPIIKQRVLGFCPMGPAVAPGPVDRETEPGEHKHPQSHVRRLDGVSWC